MNREIEIVGAGPAGLVTAINLAIVGYKVSVYEEKPDTRYRCIFMSVFKIADKKMMWKY